jgi:hypothetical protein
MFQELFNNIQKISIEWVLTLAITFLKIQESIEIPTPKMRAQLGVWRFIPSHSLTLLKA